MEDARPLIAPSSRAPILSARGVTRRYGAAIALAPLDLDVVPAEVVGLVGPNGAGKSTLLAILAAALPQTAGTVTVSPHTTVGWLPQRPGQYGHLSAVENLRLFARLMRLPHIEQEASAMLDLVELADDGRPARQLSAGNQQRLSLAISMLGSPDLLLMDEPTASLDLDRRDRLWRLIAEARSAGRSAVFSTHFLEEVEHVADRVIVLSEGVQVFAGPLAEYVEHGRSDR